MSTSTIIKCGKLYDGINDTLQENMQILVEDNKIKEVDKQVTQVKGAEVIDLSQATVTPGLSDAHVHFGFIEWKNRRNEFLFEPPSWKGMAVLYNAKKALRRGFTTVRHMGNNGDDDYGCITAKRLIDAGYFEGSRLVVAPHYVSTTRSHGDSTQGIAYNHKVAAFIWNSYPGRGCGVDMFTEVVRTQIKCGADFIKMFATGGFSTQFDGPEEQQLSDDEMRAIIDTAHQLDKTVTSHSYDPILVRKQVDMGIDCIEHGALIDDPELLKLMQEKGVHLVPTFSPYDSVIFQDEKNLANQTPEMQIKLRKYAAWLQRARKVIVESSMDLGYGTDFVAHHNPYDSGFEYETMIKSGLEPMRALKACTRVNAKILGLEGKVGGIAPGYFADIAAWKKDLLSEPRALLDCHFVMKNGVVYPTESSEY